MSRTTRYPDDAGDGDGVYLGEDDVPESWPRVTGRGRRAAIVATVVCLVAVGVPAGLVVVSGNGSPARSVGSTTTTAPPATTPSPHGGTTTAGGRAVLSALNATTAAGNFDMTYNVSATPGTATAPTTTTTTVCRQVGTPVLHTGGPPSASVLLDPATGAVRTVCSGGPVPGPSTVPFSGSGTIDVNPYAMVASSTVVGGVTVRVSSTSVWEDLGHADPSLVPPASAATGTGQPLSGFAGLVESTLGVREGAIAMMAMASPTGYLDLYQQEVTGAAPSGTGTVGGQAVTYYTVTVPPAGEASPPGASPEELTTIGAALSVLKQQGYTGSTIRIGIGTSGYILRSTSTARFADGGTVTLDSTFSTFGCAGTVLMPGQQGPTAPPAGCVSPVPTTTTTPPPPSTTTPAPTTTTPAPTTTTPAPTTTTPAPTTIPTTAPPPSSTTTSSTS